MEEINFFTDAPISNEDDDFFNRKDFSLRIADTIKNRNYEDSIVLSINGRWGEGKTSVINLIRKKLKAEKDLILVDFNPWRYSDEDQLLGIYFNTVAKKIKEDLNKNKPENWWIKNITNKKDSLATDLEFISDFIKNSDSLISMIPFKIGEGLVGLRKLLSTVDLEKLKSRFENLLKKTSKRIVIFIDDIDRLSKKEIQLILKLVKLTGEIKRTTYILSFDKEIVSAAIEDNYSKNNRQGQNFLEKIVQIPLTIPKIRLEDLERFTSEKILGVFKGYEINPEVEKLKTFLRIFSKNILENFLTPRTTIRFTNSISFGLPMLIGEVDIFDFMLIESIRIFYPNYYDFIYKNPEYFIDTYLYKWEEDKKNSIKISEINHHLTALSENLSVKEKNSCERILINLFPHFGNMMQSKYFGDPDLDTLAIGKKIGSKEYFYKYFIFTISENDISDVEIENILFSLSKTNFDEKIKNIKSIILKTKPIKVINKIFRIEKSLGLNQKKNLIPLLVKISPFFEEEDYLQHPLISSPVQLIARKIVELIQEVTTVEERPVLISKILEKTSIEFSYELLEDIRANSRIKEEEEIIPEGEFVVLIKDLIAKAIGESGEEPFFKVFPFKISNYLITVWGYWVQAKEELGVYIKKHLDNEPKNSLHLIRAFTPEIISNANPMPYKADFAQKEYMALTDLIDPNFVKEKVLEGYNNVIYSSEYIKSDHKPSNELLLNQFIVIYNNNNIRVV